MTNLLSRFAKDESGATAIEYGLIAGIVSIAIITSLTLLKPQLTGVFDKITAAMTTANTP
jgi:pilus assembly protein Flp/PilA